MASFSEFTSSLGTDGRQFEHFVKWFLKNDPEWSTQVDKVWLWNEYPERWGRDCGIDLVFKNKNGETWAVQAKNYSSSNTITKHDIDKFLSESNRSIIDKRLLIATTDRISANAKQVCDAQEKQVIRFMLWDFEHAEIDFPASFSELGAAKRKNPPTPRDYQQEAITNVLRGFERNDRGQLIMACGTGKTFTALWIKEGLNAERTLVLLPSLSLLSQTLREWTFASSIDLEVLCVCSDITVGKRGADDAISSISDVAFPVTSDTKEIRKFLSSDGNKVIFCTYQSSFLISEAQKPKRIPAFDLVVADEAHRCAGKTDSQFSTVLHQKLIVSGKRLFMTATPRTYTTSVKKSADARGIEIVGMDDEEAFGQVFHLLSFSEAISRSPALLTDYRVVIIGVDEPMIADWIKHRELIRTESGKVADAESLAAIIGLIKSIRDYDIRRAISFHSRVNRAQRFSESINDVCQFLTRDEFNQENIWTDFVSGAMPTDKRRAKLDELKELNQANRGLLTNAKCLSEGVDVPSLDGVAFIDPRRSQVDIVQAVGRAIRLSAHKTFGTIVLPVFIESTEAAESSIQASRFKPIWDVITALRAHDDALSEELDEIRTQLGKRPGTTVSTDAFSKISIDLPLTVDKSFIDSIRTILVEQTTDSWHFWFGLLQDFVNEHGHARVIANHKTSHGFALGQWVYSQRQKRDRLSSEKIRKLEELDGWIWSVFDWQWEEGFSELQRYFNREGKALVPSSYIADNGFALGNWVSTQITNRENLSIDRKERLEALTGWAWDRYAAAWEEGFSQLQRYTEREGSARVPTSYKTDKGFALGAWVRSQITNRDELNTKYKRRLEALNGWTWLRHQSNWQLGFSELQAFVREEGHSRVAQRFVSKNGFALGSWVSRQRQIRDQLSENRRQKLEQLNGWTWDLEATRWEQGFSALRQYVKLEGDALVPQGYKTSDGYALGNWVRGQREKKQRLSSIRRKRLESLNGWSWELLSDQWEKGFSALKHFVKNEGNARVQSSFHTKDGFALGNWVNRQIRNKDSLTDERRKRLEHLNGWTWDKNQTDWENRFTKLAEFVDKYGNALVPASYKTQSGFRLGNWVSRQRKIQDRLTKERKEKLEALRGWTWDLYEAAWEKGFKELRLYTEREGSARVPTSYKTDEGYALGAWVRSQITNRNSLSKDRKERLEAVKGWTWLRIEAQWEIGFESLMQFVSEEGHAEVPYEYETKDGFALGHWVGTQRKNMKRLSTRKKQQLNEVKGWVWNVLEQRWEKGFEHLMLFVEINGHSRVPLRYVSQDGFALGSWASEQRRRRQKLTKAQLTKLESIHGWAWDVLDTKWEEGFSALEAFVERNGSAKVPTRYKTKDGFSLGNWVSVQKRNRERLSRGRIERLQSLAGWEWNTLEDRWERGLAELKFYVNTVGNTKVPQRYKSESGFALGYWVARQRKNQKKLSTDRKGKLESIPSWHW